MERLARRGSHPRRAPHGPECATPRQVPPKIVDVSLEGSVKPAESRISWTIAPHRCKEHPCTSSGRSRNCSYRQFRGSVTRDPSDSRQHCHTGHLNLGTLSYSPGYVKRSRRILCMARSIDIENGKVECFDLTRPSSTHPVIRCYPSFTAQNRPEVARRFVHLFGDLSASASDWKTECGFATSAEAHATTSDQDLRGPQVHPADC
jgi:hypothetical protein